MTEKVLAREKITESQKELERIQTLKFTADENEIAERKKIEQKLREESAWLKFLSDAKERLWNINNLSDGYREIISTSAKLTNADFSSF